MNIESPAPVYFSLIIPAYNEEQRIGNTLRRAEAYLARLAFPCEIIVVDDGSTDHAANLIQKDFPEITLIRYQPNHGKGYAVKTGMLAARGAYRVFYDADGSTPIEEIDKLWPCFEAGSDIVIGSRSIPGADIRVRQNRLRESMGRIFNLFVRILVIQGLVDTQCGFKAFRGEIVNTIFHRQRLHGFCFDTEILYIARRHGLSITEIPVRWAHESHSRVHMIFDSLRMLRDLFRIRWNAFLGRYR